MNTTVHMLESVRVVGVARAGAVFELAKPRIALLVLIACAAGFYMGLPAGVGRGEWGLLLCYTLLGTALVAAGANALNQWLEADFDLRMQRTAGRPIPSGRLTAPEVLTFGAASAVAGCVLLGLIVNVPAALLAGATFGSYVFLYTPLKRRTALCVFVGAVPGALPPVIGWAAASGTLSVEAWLLFAIVFFWQLPHFVAIAWLYRDDYRRGGFPMLPVVDRDGTRTNLHMMTHSLALLVASLLPVYRGFAGPTYGVGALLLGVAFLACGVLFVIRRTSDVARFHLLASIVYLPALCALLALDKARGV